MLIYVKNRKVKVIYDDKTITLPENLKEKINENWQIAIKQTPELWNGDIFCVRQLVENETEIILNCSKTNYAHYLYDERIELTKEYACSSLVAGCLLETSDNYYIVGELAENTSFPHCMQISGGSADNEDIKDGEIDIFNTIIRECQEELNINLQDKNQVEHFEIKYICLPSETVHTYILFAKGKLNMTKAQMQEYYEQYLKYLKDNNLEVEFGRIHFIKRDKTTEELEKFENPKREYLKSLLEIDSKEKQIEQAER